MSTRNSIALILGCFLLARVPAAGQDRPEPPAPPAPDLAVTAGWSPWVFQSHPFFDPLMAEHGAAVMSVMALGSSSPFPFSQEPGRRRVWTISAGKEIPVFGWNRQYRRTTANGESKVTDCFATDDYPPPGCSGFGVWVPVSLHTVEDFKDPSNPIVNTNYRFGGMLKYERRLGRAGEKDVRLLKFRGYFGHESTHLGDEFSLAAQRNRDESGFKRINVSYQYWEYGISYEHLHGLNLFKVRHGATVLDPLTSSWTQGFYSFDPVETNAHTVTPSSRKVEPSFGFEYFRENRPGRAPAYKPFVSVDVRHKTVFDFAKAHAGQPDDRQWSVNLLAGVRHSRGIGEKRMPSLYWRMYYGVNPWGQLGSQRNYLVFGVGLHLIV